MSSQQSLDSLFNPRSIAVIGATPRRGTIGNELLHNIVRFGFTGVLFPINPKHKSIHSIKAYPSVLDVPDPVDLAVIIVPKEHVIAVAKECGEKGVKSLLIISAGFREIGGEGIKREEELARLKDEYGFRIIGPNCMGVINTKADVRLNATFAPTQPDGGAFAFMTQSGALGVAILQAVKKLNLGLSYFVSVGNKVDVAANDLLEYWADDPDTRVIGLYLESFGDPRRFTQLSRRVTRKKPVLVVKSGRTAAGARAASSHTGHLAGLEIAVDALLHQCGVIRVPTIEAMMDLVLAFTKNPIPQGDRIAVVTNAGGPGIMATDALVNEGLRLAELGAGTQESLRAILPAESSVRNPVDMIASAGPPEYTRVLDLVLADEGVDTAIVIFVPPIMIEPLDVAASIAGVTQRHRKPVFSVLMAEDAFYDELPRRVPDAPPMYRFPESAARAIAEMGRYRRWCERPEGTVGAFDVDKTAIERIITGSVESDGGYLGPADVNSILEAYGFPVCKIALVPVEGDIEAAAGRVGYPLVLKAHGPSIVHKSDFGGVETDIGDARALDAARARMLDKLKTAGMLERVDGLLVQEMARSGKEVIIGMATDAKFGPLLMFGMGGKYVEILKDITFRVMPVTDLDAWEMVKGIRSYPLLEGIRGDERVDIEFIVQGIQRLAQLVTDWPQIAEIDMNPVIVVPEAGKSRVVDARIRIAAP